MRIANIEDTISMSEMEGIMDGRMSWGCAKITILLFDKEGVSILLPKFKLRNNTTLFFLMILTFISSSFTKELLNTDDLIIKFFQLPKHTICIRNSGLGNCPNRFCFFRYLAFLK
tara:strand:+ start:13358 stop:13702 length:345 start_codon:yes stop_codon:yes gene_type:complete